MSYQVNSCSISSAIFLITFQSLLEPRLSVSEMTSFKDGKKGAASLVLSCYMAKGTSQAF